MCLIDDGVQVIVMVLSLLVEEEMVFMIVMMIKLASVMTIKVMVMVELVLKTVIS